jgi:hypothetical protein
MRGEAPPGTAGVPQPGMPGRLAYLYRTHLVRTEREDHFLVWSSFAVTFAATRFVTHSIHAGRFRHLFRNVTGHGGRHIHHLVFGIAGLLVGGYIAAAYHPRRADARRGLALLYGASAALTLDEFALWLDLEDVYWAKQGRVSVDAVVISGALMAAGGTARHLLLALAHDGLVAGRRAWARLRGDPPPR